ncbi:MAG: biotin synthase BioB, partial [Terriglobales bacterium]
MAYTADQVSRIFHLPLLELIEQAHAVHKGSQTANQVQLCHLLSIKTGGCPEDCAYCPQSARYHTGVEPGKLLDRDEVLAEAERARAGGATRFCMGAAWRQVKDGPEFDRVLEMVRGVAGLGLEVCCTLGMLTPEQARRLGAAGLTAYNHNLDTSPEFYGNIITTRTYEDRLRTLENIRAAGITVCCGGILGMGEGENDRIRLLATLANLNPPPESVPINALVAVEGTPLAQQAPLAPFEFVRAIATARILMPHSKVRLSAGRLSLSPESQALCFYAGANSIFVGDKLLT